MVDKKKKKKQTLQDVFQPPKKQITNPIRKLTNTGKKGGQGGKGASVGEFVRITEDNEIRITENSEQRQVEEA